jgi:hypothetical protein
MIRNDEAPCYCDHCRSMRTAPARVRVDGGSISRFNLQQVGNANDGPRASVGVTLSCDERDVELVANGLENLAKLLRDKLAAADHAKEPA